MQTQTQEIDLLKSAMRQASDKRMYERYLAVLHHLEGQTTREIARMIKRTEKTTSAYIHHYREGGLVSALTYFVGVVITVIDVSACASGTPAA
ncbi:helix-turn-helix domain-containing protein [Paenibacillus sp. NPDC056579]|uniref:helix-turn-helix domain-containing protein n=1 Tax=unclassified Paenibacillus TaxID=185978 RepID=UPI001EF839AA|nr:helix-turn-helix domain-containing protein [Paenibacillus sp. H1-7]